jgi:hypothetical protein
MPKVNSTTLMFGAKLLRRYFASWGDLFGDLERGKMVLPLRCHVLTGAFLTCNSFLPSSFCFLSLRRTTIQTSYTWTPLQSWDLWCKARRIYNMLLVWMKCLWTTDIWNRKIEQYIAFHPDEASLFPETFGSGGVLCSLCW